MRAGVFVSGLCAVALLAPAVPALAQADDLNEAFEASEAEPLDLSVLLADRTSLHLDVLAQVQPDGPEFNAALQDATEAAHQRDNAAEELRLAIARQVFLAEERQELEDRLSSAEAMLVKADAAYERALQDLKAYAVGTFMGFEEDEVAVNNPLDAEPDRRPVLAQAVGDHILRREKAATEALAAAEARVAELKADLSGNAIANDVAESREVLAIEDQSSAESSLEQAADRVADAAALSTVPGLNLPLVVLDAYYSAALVTNRQYPACAVEWWHLAGIGRVESGHGTFGGSTVDRDGQTTQSILGPVLDGDPWLAISDTDGGRLDGNTVWDRAVGPMQFIPGSWSIFGGDGNSDGVSDPHNLYDAAAAAGQHLCRSHSGLGDEANLRRSLLGYNRSVAYGSSVISIGRHYASALSLSVLNLDLQAEAEATDDDT